MEVGKMALIVLHRAICNILNPDLALAHAYGTDYTPRRTVKIISCLPCMPYPFPVAQQLMLAY